MKRKRAEVSARTAGRWKVRVADALREASAVQFSLKKLNKGLAIVERKLKKLHKGLAIVVTKSR